MVAVLLFHAHWLPGGFVGVDVFFVISGYLMTTIIYRGLSRDNFSMRDFYGRRARRIIPVFAVVVLLTAIAGIFLLLPGDVRQLGRSVSAAASFTSNHFFMKTAADYFSADSVAYQPLLHSWTLSVEMQFYAIFPLMLVALWRFFPGRRPMLWLLSVCGFISLILSEGVLRPYPEAAFYLLPMRMWELLLGGVVALLPEALRHKKIFAGLGFACIFAAIAFYSGATEFPGLHALLPCLGAAMVLYARPTHALLQTLPVRQAALWSYSLYLWHWPLFALARYQLGEDLAAVHTALILMFTVLLSALSYRFVEKPFLSGKTGGWKPFLAPLCFMIVILAAGPLTKNLFSKWAYANVDPAIQKILMAERDYIKKDCQPGMTGRDHDLPCAFGATAVAPSVFVWGNSFARMWAPAIDFVAKEKGVSGVSSILSACPPLAVTFPGENEKCRIFNSEVFAYLTQNPQLTTIILAANWGGDDERLHAFEETLRQLAALDRHIVVIINPPYPGYNVPRMLATRKLRNQDPPPLVTEAEWREQESDFLKNIRLLAIRHNVQLVDPGQFLCRSGLCAVSDDGVPLYYDSAHLTRSGALKARSVLIPVFERH